MASQSDNARTEWLLSRSLAAMGDLERALKLADAALASDSSDVAYDVQVAAVAALALDASDPEAQWGLMIYYYAMPALIGGDKAKAVQIGERMAASAPAVGRYYQGRLALQIKDADKAESLFR